MSAGTLLAALIVPVQGAAYAAVSDPASLVNPLLGTTNGANDFPGADVPFGMTQWSPDTASRARRRLHLHQPHDHRIQPHPHGRPRLRRVR